MKKWARRSGAVLETAGFLTAVAVLVVAVLVQMPRSIAGDTATVNVLANVIGNCKFNTASASLNFGNLDPAVGTDVSATTSLTFWCTKNATFTITDDNGQNFSTNQRMINTSVTPNEYIPYTYCYTTGAAITPCNSDTTSVTGQGAGKNTAITLNISGTVKGTDYINASAGSYSDTVTMTITP